MSRVVRFSQTGGPDVLKIEDVDVPAPGAGEVRISVKAIGLNRSESMWRNGAYIEVPKFPARLGYEASGVIESVGPGVTNLAVGDAVSVLPGFSQNKYGTYAELMLAPAQLAIKYPSNLSYEEAATMWMMFLTAYGGLVERADVQSGDVVLIPGASSGVGLAAIQIVNYLGGVPIALTRTSAKREQLLDAGAADVIATQEQDLVKEVNRLTDTRGADVVFDPVVGPTFSKLVQVTAKKGRIVIYGALSTQPTELPVLEILTKNPTIYAYGIFETTYNRELLKVAAKFVLDGFESGAFKAVIDEHIFTLDEIVKAHEYLEANDVFGKIVVKVAD
jgi:NADPH:quinone reductase-like Zn-dependent oxidoreductase